MYKETYSTSTDPIPDFSERVPPEIALELSVLTSRSSDGVLTRSRLMASDFLEV